MRISTIAFILVALPACAAEPAAHWAFVPPTRPAVPAGGQPPYALLFVERGQHGLRPRPEAERRPLRGRVYLDLIGLPPTPAEVDAFIHDVSPGAFATVVDRLLASPRSGERWGRHWVA